MPRKIEDWERRPHMHIFQSETKNTKIPQDHIWLTLTLFFNKTLPFQRSSHLLLILPAIPQSHYQIFFIQPLLPTLTLMKWRQKKIDITVFHHQNITFFPMKGYEILWGNAKKERKKEKSTFDLMREIIYEFSKDANWFYRTNNRYKFFFFLFSSHNIRHAKNHFEALFFHRKWFFDVKQENRRKFFFYPQLQMENE